jgi:hypothetical protein
MLKAFILEALKGGSKLSIRQILNDVVVRRRYPLTEEDIEIVSTKDNSFKIIGIHNDIYNEIARLEKAGLVRVDRPGNFGLKRGITLVSLV